MDLHTDRILLAKKIATEAHEGQTRWDKTTPYITHPAAVVEMIIQDRQLEKYRPMLRDHRLYYEYVICAAWLHDVLEDCPTWTTDRLLQEGVHSTVVQSVVFLTKGKDQSYLQYLLDVIKEPIARVVKTFDIKHNLSCLDKKQNKNKVDKYELALYILENAHDRS